jgi:proteasome accessory factor B
MFVAMAAPEFKRRDRQVVRILGILGALLEGGRPSVHDLARRFGTRRETIYRDLRALEDAGYPVTGEGGHLSRPRLLGDGKKAPQVRFTSEELNALDWAVAQAKTGPFSAVLDSARQKLEVIGAARGQGEIGMADVTDSWGPAAPETAPAVLLRLAEAILRRRVCQVEYRTPEAAEAKTYRYYPYRLRSVAGAYYCVGQVPPHEGITTLAAHRIIGLELLPDTFIVDPTLDLDRYRNEAFGVIWESPVRVLLRFRPDQAPYVAERQWHPSQEIQWQPDGGLELSFRAGGLFEIRRWILGWGDAVEVLEPRSLRDSIGKLLFGALTLYGC